MEARGSRKKTISRMRAPCHSARGAWNRVRPALVPRKRARSGLISRLAPMPGGRVLQEHDCGGNEIQHPDHGGPIPEAEILESVVEYFEGQEEGRIVRAPLGHHVRGSKIILQADDRIPKGEKQESGGDQRKNYQSETGPAPRPVHMGSID